MRGKKKGAYSWSRRERKAVAGGGAGNGSRSHCGVRYPQAIRRKAVQLTVEEGIPISLVAQELGVTDTSICKWTRRYRAEGEAGLHDRPRRRKKPGLPKAVVEKIVELKKTDPTRGARKLSDMLRRLFFMKASPSVIGKYTKAHGLATPRKKKHRVQTLSDRRFEYSKPNEFWQSDITVFKILGKDAYIIGFIDDHSRYVTGLGLYRGQTSENVLETYRRAVGEYGVPKELLTDNGRQYASWRGKTKFQKELAKDHVHHIRSSPHHPQTLGKIERFWQTMKEEFLQRATFATFEEAQERLAYWLKYYNHQRPHQSLEGLCPADRFFGIRKDIKAAIEKNMTTNMQALALCGKPIEPFYMVGRVGARSVVIGADKQTFSVVVDGREVSASNGEINNEAGRDRKDGVGEEAATAEVVQCEGKKPGDPEPVEREAERSIADEGAVGAVASAARLGAAGNGGDTDGAGPEPAADFIRSQLSPGPGGKTDIAGVVAADGADDRTADLKGRNDERDGTGTLRGDGEGAGRAVGVDGAKESLRGMPGALDKFESPVAVAGSRAIGYVGGAGTEGTGRQGRSCPGSADETSAGSENHGAGVGVCRKGAAEAPGTGDSAHEFHDHVTKEVIWLGNGGESAGMAEGDLGSACRADERDRSICPARGESQDVLREAGTSLRRDAGSLGGSAHGSAGESGGPGEGRASGRTGREPEGNGTTGSQAQSAECSAAGADGSRCASVCG